MAAILQTFLNSFSWMKTVVFFIKISKSQINNKPSVSGKGLRQTGDKP